MKLSRLLQLSLFTFLSLFMVQTYAWNNSVELGYGYSHDWNHTKYHNSGFLLSGDIFPLYRSPWMFWSITGSLGQWHTTEPTHQNLTTGAVSLGLRLYGFDFGPCYHSYLLGSAGPAYLSHRQFGFNKQGSNFTFQTNLGLGAELNNFDINLRLSHFSNAHIYHPDQGFTVIYLLSVGYLF